MPDYNLTRFLDAQEQIFAQALEEIRRGRKTSHWMWFIFPQLLGLGASETAQRYAIRSLGEAQAYLEHTVLGRRLLECVEALQNLPLADPKQVFGSVDALKLRSSLTLFERAGGGSIFAAAIDRWFNGEADPQTDLLLDSA